MTATPTPLRPVRPGQVKNALLNVLARHGIEPATCESIWADLSTGQDPRPGQLPAQFIYRGIQVVWPIGRRTRPLRPDELRTLNAALRAANPPKQITYKDGSTARSYGVRKRDSLLDPEDTAEVGRHAYEFLWRSFKSADYNPEPVRAAAMRALVEEATAERHAEPEWCGCGANINGQQEHECDPLACMGVSPGGKACLLPIEHDGKCKNGRTTWTRKHQPHTPAEKLLVDIFTQSEEPKAQEPAAQPAGDTDALTQLSSTIDQLLNTVGAGHG